jgi:hypothetical protein
VLSPLLSRFHIHEKSQYYYNICTLKVSADVSFNTKLYTCLYSPWDLKTQRSYKIPLLPEPKSVFLTNKSSYAHTNFLENAASELISGGLVRKVSSELHVVTPLTVAVNSKGKDMLILDLGSMSY